MHAQAENHAGSLDAHFEELDQLEQTYHAAPISYVRTSPGDLGAGIHAAYTPRVEVRQASFQTDVVLAVDAQLARFALGVCQSGMVTLLGAPLGSNNVGYTDCRNGVFVSIRGASTWCNVSIERNFLRAVAETHRYDIPDGDESYGLSSVKRLSLARSLAKLARSRLNGNPASDEAFEDQAALLILRALNPPQARARQKPGRQNAIIRVAVDYIHAHYADRLTVTKLCDTVGVSERTLLYAFVGVFGISPQKYLMSYRLEHARSMLLHDCAPVSEVAHACGIRHVGRFSAYFKEKFGELPSALGPKVF